MSRAPKGEQRAEMIADENGESPLYEGSSERGAAISLWENSKAFPRSLTLSAFISGFLVVLVAATGPIVIMLQAARAGHFTDSETATWICSSWVMSGFFSLYLSLRYRMPMIGSTSTAAIVLLVTSLQSHTIHEAVASYLIVSVLFILVGATRVMPKIMRAIPHQLVMAMLAGVLFNFGVNIFTQFDAEPIIISGMVISYFIARIIKLRAPVAAVLFIGVLLSVVLHRVTYHSPYLGLTHLDWVSPHFTFGSLINLAIPMFLLTIATQFAPGFAVLKSNGYKSPQDQSLIASGIISLLTAGFLNSGTNTSAITASIAVGEHADPDQSTRYTSGVITGILYIVAGMVGASIVTLFSSLPAAMLAALAGLALFPALAQSLHDSLLHVRGREASLVTLLVTISRIHPLQLGSPFWGLIAGTFLYALPNLRSRSA